MKPPILDAAMRDGFEPAQDADAPDTDQLFRQLVDRHRVRLQRFVMRHIGQPDDAEDIAQQAFAEAVRTIERFRGESELSTWLYGIAMNLVRNYLSRAPHRMYRFETDESLTTMFSPDGDPGDNVSMQQTLRQLSESMAELPREMREVLTLVAIEETAYEDAAAMLSVPVGTVRSRLSRARAALRARLAAAGVDVPFF
ncbi:Sigma-24 [Variovorax sp. SRS16]|uniref:RNA polymerase sigma factor n=1 Tax=Variovorax sp. SRS16 TaxID=282217 RepID=UPI001317D057|nr:RNA polymerase sigma factor [Variovorax sp. SRS16]VTU12896.1 Sigma-24 [Variovorax sp. SRS16]